MRFATVTTFLLASLFLAACEQQGASEIQQTPQVSSPEDDPSVGDSAGGTDDQGLGEAGDEGDDEGGEDDEE